MSYRYEELTWPQIKQAVEEEKVVVLTVGSIEQHGHHLPISTDSAIVSAISDRAVEMASEVALLMPTVYYGYSPHHMEFPGSIAVRGEHFVNYLVDIGTSLARHGFKRIVIINGHGGNIAWASAAALDINMSTDAICATTTWWTLIGPTLQSLRESEFPGGMSHSCEAETSVLLHLRPDLVQMDKAVKNIPSGQTEFISYDFIGSTPVAFMEPLSRISETGVVGDPTVATKEKGKQIVEKAAERFAEFLREFQKRQMLPTPDHH